MNRKSQSQFTRRDLLKGALAASVSSLAGGVPISASAQSAKRDSGLIERENQKEKSKAEIKAVSKQKIRRQDKK